MGQGTAGTISHDKNFTFKCSFVGESTTFSQDLDKYKDVAVNLGSNAC